MSKEFDIYVNIEAHVYVIADSLEEALSKAKKSFPETIDRGDCYYEVESIESWE